MGIDILGIDIMGVDILGIDIVALPRPYYVTFMSQNMNISSHCTIGKHAYGTCLNGYAHFSSLFLCAINVAILGNSKNKL